MRFVLKNGNERNIHKINKQKNKHNCNNYSANEINILRIIIKHNNFLLVVNLD